MKSPQSTPVPFNSLNSDLRQKRVQAREICLAHSRNPSRGHMKKLKKLFRHCGESVFIEAGFHCDYGSFIAIGDRSYLNINCTLLDGGQIVVGDDCLVGPGVQILTINHETAPMKRLEKLNLAQDVIIGNNVWIGAGSIILPGITIESGSVIGAGSVVTKSVPGNCLYAGNPAVKVKHV